MNAPTPNAGPGREVLLVDDDPAIREIVGSLLEKQGYRVRLAEHGAEALDQVRARHPDLVLLDLRMPVMDGPELFRRLRELDDRAPVVLMSAYPELLEVAARLGADAALHKPFALRELFDVVGRLLREP